MRFHGLALVLLGIALLGAGCQALAPRAAETDRTLVAVEEDNAAVAECEAVTEVAVRLPFPLLARSYPELTSLGQAEVARELRHQARRAGGDTVVPAGVENGRTRGTVYDCGRAG
ncbi:MAG: hypothetical protein R6T83_12770 [Salinibacter sp.]